MRPNPGGVVPQLQNQLYMRTHLVFGVNILQVEFQRATEIPSEAAVRLLLLCPIPRQTPISSSFFRTDAPGEKEERQGDGQQGAEGGRNAQKESENAHVVQVAQVFVRAILDQFVALLDSHFDAELPAQLTLQCRSLATLASK